MRRLSLDLELNVDGVNPTEDIVQVGYSAFDTETGIIETTGDYIKIDKPLHPYIITLTGISQKDIDTKGVSLIEAYNNLLAFCDKHEIKSRQAVTWGAGDMPELKAQLEDIAMFILEGPGWRFGRAECNVKVVYQMYMIANGKNPSGGLGKSLKKLGLAFEPFLDVVSTSGAVRQRGAHDARADALNTAKMYLYLQNKLKT